LNDKIKLSTPPKDHELRSAQDIISIHAETGNVKSLHGIGHNLQSRSERLERKGHHEGASRVADLAALAINSAADIQK
jgi:hypothetical protein